MWQHQRRIRPVRALILPKTLDMILICEKVRKKKMKKIEKTNKVEERQIEVFY